MIYVVELSTATTHRTVDILEKLVCTVATPDHFSTYPHSRGCDYDQENAHDRMRCET